MNRPEHAFWSLVAFSASIFAFTAIFDYRKIGMLSYAFLLVVFLLSILFNELANKIVEEERKEEREKKKRNATGEKSGTNEYKKFRSMLKRVYRSITYLLLFCFIAFCFYLASPASDHPLFIASGYVGAFFGAILPDLDKDFFGIEVHRNPITHSSLLVNIVGLIALLTLPGLYVSLMLFFIGIVLGNAVHLLADNVESEGTLAQLFVDRQHFKECPGDIRKIREDRERGWLFYHTIFSMILVYMMFARFQYDFPFDYPAFWNYENYVITFTGFTCVSLGLVIYTTIYYMLSFLVYKAWKDERKKENKKRKT